MKIKTPKHPGETDDLFQFAEPEQADEQILSFDSAGSEAEEDLNHRGFNQALTWATDWTTETIVLQLLRGVIDLDPNFQRRDAWRQIRKSRFIESLVLGLPIPQIVLAERKQKRGTYFVIDGKQRLLTLKQFCTGSGLDPSGNERLTLSGLLAENRLNGKTYQDLLNDPTLNEELSAFQSQTIRTIVIKNWPTEDFLYTVFHRLNSNSVPLSPQELRKALHPGPFVNFAERASANARALQSALGITKPDFRMRDVEILIRFYAFRYFIHDYKGNLKEFLDSTCKNLNNRWQNSEKEIKHGFDQFEVAVATAQRVFGEGHAFRKFSGVQYEGRLNRAVFDIFLYYFSMDGIAELVVKNAPDVKGAFENLCSKDGGFLRSLETSTKTTDVVKKRFNS